MRNVLTIVAPIFCAPVIVSLLIHLPMTRVDATQTRFDHFEPIFSHSRGWRIVTDGSRGWNSRVSPSRGPEYFYFRSSTVVVGPLTPRACSNGTFCPSLFNPDPNYASGLNMSTRSWSVRSRTEQASWISPLYNIITKEANRTSSVYIRMYFG